MTDTGLVPDPTDCEDVDEGLASVLPVPHSNIAVVEKPFGFTEPFSVAEVAPIFVAADVVTLGRNLLK